MIQHIHTNHAHRIRECRRQLQLQCGSRVKRECIYGCIDFSKYWCIRYRCCHQPRRLTVEVGGRSRRTSGIGGNSAVIIRQKPVAMILMVRDRRDELGHSQSFRRYAQSGATISLPRAHSARTRVQKGAVWTRIDRENRPRVGSGVRKTLQCLPRLYFIRRTSRYRCDVKYDIGHLPSDLWGRTVF
jgi:hypothetical protein